MLLRTNIIYRYRVIITQWMGSIVRIIPFNTRVIADARRIRIKMVRCSRSQAYGIGLLNVSQDKSQSNAQGSSNIENSQTYPNKTRYVQSDSKHSSDHGNSKADSFGSHDKLRISINLVFGNLAFFKESKRQARGFLNSSNRIKPQIPENSRQHMRKQHQEWLTCSNQSYRCQSNIPLPYFSVRSLFLHEAHLLTFHTTMKCLTNLVKTEKFKEKYPYMWLFCQHNSSQLTKVKP